MAQVMAVARHLHPASWWDGPATTAANEGLRGLYLREAERVLQVAQAAAPLLVSAEAERMAGWVPLSRRENERLRGVVEGLRAELAERDAKLREAMRVSEWRVSAKDDEVFAIAVATLTQHWDCGDGL